MRTLKDKIKDRWARFCEPVKMRIAGYLNEKHPDYCWAKLVWWAMGQRSTMSTFFQKDDPHNVRNLTCHQDYIDNGNRNTYCGKCWQEKRVPLPQIWFEATENLQEVVQAMGGTVEDFEEAARRLQRTHEGLEGTGE